MTRLRWLRLIALSLTATTLRADPFAELAEVPGPVGRVSA